MLHQPLPFTDPDAMALHPVSLMESANFLRSDLMTKTLLFDTAILLGLIGLGVAAHRIAPLFEPQTDLRLPLSTCDLNRGPCAALLPNGKRIELTIEPRPIAVLKPLQISLKVQGTTVRKAEVDFAGTSMKMGYNRPLLERQPGSVDQFVGQTSLPVCISGTMEWEATLLLDTGQTTIALPFRFAASK